MKKQMRSVLKRAFVALIVVILICFLPFVSKYKDDELSMILNAFVGQKGKYQGVIVVWNIDDFESGTAPKTNYLNLVARSFEKTNKGTYVLVRNLNEYECLSLLEKGESPDLFSCSYSLANKLKGHITEFSDTKNLNLDSNLLESGKIDDKLFALAWCRGIYCLLSTTEKIEKSGKKLEENQRLSDVALELGYETSKKNKTKTISSLVFGANEKLLPQRAFSSYTGIKLENISAIKLNENSFTQSQYSAYASFLAGDATVLLGTQRDIFRLEKRQLSGKIKDLIYQPLMSETDLVQFCLLAKNDDQTKKESAEILAKMLVSAKFQEKISEIGMIPVLSNLNPYKSGAMFHIVSEINGDYKVFSVFD